MCIIFSKYIKLNYTFTGSLPLLPLFLWASKDVKNDKTTKKLDAKKFASCILDKEDEDVWISCLEGGSDCKTEVARISENDCGVNGIKFKRIWKKIRNNYKFKISGHQNHAFGLGTLALWALQYSMDKPFLNDLLPDLDYQELLMFIMKHKKSLWSKIKEGIAQEDYGESVAKFFIDHQDEISWDKLESDFYDANETDDNDDSINTGEGMTITDMNNVIHSQETESKRKFDRYLHKKIRRLMRDLVHRYHLYGHRCKYVFFRVCDPFYQKISFKL